METGSDWQEAADVGQRMGHKGPGMDEVSGQAGLGRSCRDRPALSQPASVARTRAPSSGWGITPEHGQLPLSRVGRPGREGKGRVVNFPGSKLSADRGAG